MILKLVLLWFCIKLLFMHHPHHHLTVAVSCARWKKFSTQTLACCPWVLTECFIIGTLCVLLICLFVSVFICFDFFLVVFLFIHSFVHLWVLLFVCSFLHIYNLQTCRFLAGPWASFLILFTAQSVLFCFWILVLDYNLIASSLDEVDNRSLLGSLYFIYLFFIMVFHLSLIFLGVGLDFWLVMMHGGL